MQTNVFCTITQLIILFPLPCYGDLDGREGVKWEKNSFLKPGRRQMKEAGGGETEGGREGGREHIRLKDLQWLYISQCLVKTARQGSENLIIA